MADPEKLQVSVAVNADMELPPAEGANFFHFTTAGPEVQMLVGCVNLLHLHEAKGVRDATIFPQITHRFTLSALGFNNLKSQLAALEALPSPGLSSETKASR
jgi:hypothetical protein